ncbi:MAG: hypothetical protein QNK37_14065 [Acidobacteriota bacterium]|nr:hypothetical protein [Acidobacteriota bacterium]
MRFAFVFLLFSLLPAFAGEGKFEKDRKAVLAMAGAYVVDFHFHETVGFVPGYDLKPAKDSAGMEIVIVVEDTPKRIVLQHILQTSRGIVKHWRQDWEYESTVMWEYQKDNVWTKRTLSKDEVKGKWTQRVYQVDDSPRYESIGAWTHIGNLSQWESALTRRPLPRREYTTRDDYNVMMAKNRHALTPTGWVHEQDNYKLHIDEDGGEKVIAREFGLNTYDHANEDKLSEAVAWWQENSRVWKDVRSVWTELFKREERIALAEQIEDKALYRHIFAMAREAMEAETYDGEQVRKRTEELIQQFRKEAENVGKTASL